VQVVVERADHDAVREALLVLRPAAAERQVAARLRPLGDLGEQPGLAEAEAADERDAAPLAFTPDAVERRVDRAELLGPSDESGRAHGHSLKDLPYTGARPGTGGLTSHRMPVFVLTHHHAPGECASAFAAWKGFDSPLRHQATLASCLAGGHSTWWQVVAPDAAAALAQLPPFVARRTAAEQASEFLIP
jgi:hypothetical protein